MESTEYRFLLPMVDGKLHALLKGKIYTQTFLRAVLNKEWGLRTGRQLSHVLLMKVPAYHKMLFLTDSPLRYLLQ